MREFGEADVGRRSLAHPRLPNGHLEKRIQSIWQGEAGVQVGGFSRRRPHSVAEIEA